MNIRAALQAVKGWHTSLLWCIQLLWPKNVQGSTTKWSCLDLPWIWQISKFDDTSSIIPMNPCSTPSLVRWGWGGICCHVAAWLNRNVICLPSPLCPGPGYKSTALLLAADGGNRQADTQTLAVFAKNCLRTPSFHEISATFLVFVRTNRTLYL